MANADVEARVDQQVKSEIAAHAARPTEPARIGEVAADLRSRAVSNVVADEHEERAKTVAARVSQFVDLGFGIVYVLLLMRFGLTLAGANTGARFGRVLVAITNPLYAPFRGILGAPDVDGGGQFVMSLLVAIVVYLLAHLGVHQLLHTLAVRRRTI
jgi:uncharacterized protein YggT (Ycf19 family)